MAVKTLRVVHNLGDGRGRVFQATKTRDSLENGRHGFDDALLALGSNFRRQDLRNMFGLACVSIVLRATTLPIFCGTRVLR